jgi:prophage tail gpP-like protein
MTDILSIVLDGSEYVNFTHVEVHVSFLNICRQFQARVSLPDDNLSDYPIQIGQNFVVKVNDEKVVSGYIEKIRIQQDNTTRVLQLYGRDYLADLVDSTIDFSILQPFNGNITFKNVCSSVLSNLNINSSVRSNIDQDFLFSKDDYITPDVGETCSDYLQKYADKAQVFSK